MSEETLQMLHAYHDGELGAFARWRFERQLARSPELRAELASLRAFSELAAEVGSEVALPAGSVWAGIEGRLRAVDAAVEAEAGAVRATPAWWRPVGAAAVAAVGVLALFLAFQPATVPPGDGAIASGVRYLDAGGQSVMVQEREDVTIIWMMGGPDDA